MSTVKLNDYCNESTKNNEMAQNNKALKNNNDNNDNNETKRLIEINEHT